MTIHLTTSADFGAVVRRALREPVRFVPDHWLVGPALPDPEAHALARCDYWGLQGQARARLVRSYREVAEALGAHDRVVVWASRPSNDFVASLAFCAWRLLRGPSELDIWSVVLGAAAEDLGGSEIASGPVRVTPAEVRRRAEDLHPLPSARVRELAAHWSRLSGDAPILAGGNPPDELRALGNYQAGFFPRSESRGLVLSRFDELLLSSVGDEWAAPVDVFVRKGTAGDELRKWLRLTGDVFLALRLAQWATHGGADAALESEPLQPDNVMRAARYRLSQAGRGLVNDGLGDITRGAPMPVWGATAFDPGSPWLVVDRGGVPCIVRGGQENERSRDVME
jgi:hypothetical protein